MAAPINTKFCIHAQYLATPAIGVMTELIQLSALYRFVEEGWMNTLQRNSEVYLIKFQKLTSARAAKRHMDEKSFFGGLLHNTRLKLQDGRYVNRTAQNKGTDDVTMVVQGPDWEFSQDTGVNTPTLTISAMGSFFSDHRESGHPFNIPLHRAMSPIIALGHWDIFLDKRNGCLLLALQHHFQQHLVTRTNPAPNISGTPSSSGGNRWMVKRLSKNPPPAPKMDMVDESLNTTANMVRNTLKKVYSWSFFLKSSQQRRRQSQESLRR
uniref:Uncharacterized protein n=1 Tax=Oncorhynchus tshawytscha TaxID=74940 RepID=A0AAZ3PAV5_ONCTS